MRVTKNIRKFIEDEVSKRVNAKYEDELEEEKWQNEYLEALRTTCAKAAAEAFFAKAEQLKKDFCVVDDKEGLLRQRNYFCPYNAIQLVREGPSVARKIIKETDDITNSIIVELELGGDKTKLMELLNNI